MAFDAAKFVSQGLSLREADVPVDNLASFFGEGEKPVFRVRGLSGAEIARANEAREQAKNIGDLAAAIAGSSGADKVTAIKEMLGIGENTPDDLIRRQAIAVHGIIEPKLDLDAVVKLAEFFPMEFYNITNRILFLTGEGSVLGKQKRSTAKVASGDA